MQTIIIETLLDYDDSWEASGRILDKIEKLGMLPPTCTVTIEDGKHTATERRWDTK